VRELLDLAINGVILGGIYVLLALGLNIILGMIGVLNFMHGALYMIGAYLAWTLTTHGMNFLVAAVVAALGIAVLGVVMEVLLIRPLYGRIPEHALLLTFGLTLIATQGVRYIWGDAPRSLDTPALLSSNVNLLGYHFPLYRLFVVVVTAVAVAAVWLLINKTNVGLIIRAGITDSEMVGALGINLPLAFTLTFALGSLLAGLGGALVGPVTGLNTGMGDSFIILAFVVVVIGGLGNFWGSIVGGVLVGLIQSLTVQFWGPAADIVPFVLMIAVLLVRPRGLFGVEGVFDT
jgi:branched-subunit amino acid ABC-type transport system permease component